MNRGKKKILLEGLDENKHFTDVLMSPEWEEEFLKGFMGLEKRINKNGYDLAIKGIQEIYQKADSQNLFAGVLSIIHSLGFRPDDEYRASTYPFRAAKDKQKFLLDNQFIRKISDKPLIYKTTDKGKMAALLYNMSHEILPFYDTPLQVAIYNNITRPSDIVYANFPTLFSKDIKKEDIIRHVSHIRYADITEEAQEMIIQDKNLQDFISNSRRNARKVDMELEPAAIMPSRSAYQYSGVKPNGNPVIVQLDDLFLDKFYLEYGNDIKLRVNHQDIDKGIERLNNASPANSENIIPVFIFNKEDEIIGYIKGIAGVEGDGAPHIRHRFFGVAKLKALQSTSGI